MKPREAPFSEVLALGSRSKKSRVAAALGGAVLLYGLLAVCVWTLQPAAKAKGAQPEELQAEVTLEAPEPEPEQPEPEPEPLAAEPPPPPPAAPVEPPPEESAPPREEEPPPTDTLAQAGEVLTAESDDAAPSEEDFSVVEGDAGHYAGGTTSSTGTSAQSVALTSGGVDGGTGPRTRARAPFPQSSGWTCDWPRVPDDIRHEKVTLRVLVDEEGNPEQIFILHVSDERFRQSTLHCAQRQKFWPALDAEGHKVPGMTRDFTVGYYR